MKFPESWTDLALDVGVVLALFLLAAFVLAVIFDY